MSNSAGSVSDGGLWGNLVRYFRDFKVLRHTRSEYWGIQIINFLDSTTFFSILTIAVILLSDDFGFSDEKAGYVVTLYASTTTICLFFSGMVTDWLGIRRAFYTAMIGQFLTRGAIMVLALSPMLFPEYRGVIVTIAFFLMAPFVAMIQTVYQAANKRFTTKKSRGAGFNLWYLFMNIGAFAAGLLIDFIRLTLGLPNGHIFTFAVIAHVISFFLIMGFIRREEQIYDEGEEPTPEEAAKPKERKTPWQIAGSVLKESIFWRFLVLISLLIGVRACFLYLHLLWPKYWLRVIGPEAKIGVLQAINPFLVIFGLILLIPILNRFSVYKMLTFGGMISGLSLFVLAVPSYGHMTYVYSIIALVVLTVGEVIWSPRLNEYTAAIAPEGQEGTYLGLSMVPYFFAKTVVSLLSGHMLTRWVPLDMGERLRAGTVAFVDSPSMLWLILGAFALGGPLVALLLKDWFTKGAHWEKARR
ncbi:MAG: MFS transporter [Candidatus Eisenbacteria bacterium]|nr:MFS transporter [Candidatus Eisenbacteria bacterium]